MIPLSLLQSTPEDIGSPVIFYYPVLILFIIILAVFTIAVVLITCLFVLLAAAGIFSTAVIVGLYNRSLKKGFKAAIWMLCCFAGASLGAIGLWILDHFRPLSMSLPGLLSVGALLGLVVGIAGASLVITVLRWALHRTMQKLSKTGVRI